MPLKYWHTTNVKMKKTSGYSSQVLDIIITLQTTTRVKKKGWGAKYLEEDSLDSQ